MVRGDLAGDELLAEPEDGVHDGAVAASGEGIGGEQDAGRVGVHQFLNDDREGNGAGGHVVAGAVGDGALGPEAGPAFNRGVADGVEAADVEERVLLAGEGRLGQVLGGGRGADGDRAVGEVSDGCGDASALVGVDRTPERRPDQLGRLARFARPDGLGDDGVQVVLGDERAVLVGAQDDERRHREARVAQGDQVGALAAQGFDAHPRDSSPDRGRGVGVGVVGAWLRGSAVEVAWVNAGGRLRRTSAGKSADVVVPPGEGRPRCQGQASASNRLGGRVTVT